MEYYEKTFTDIEEARIAAKETKGKISSFLSLDENGEIITVYSVKYRQLF
jgi:hypothetical protein